MWRWRGSSFDLFLPQVSGSSSVDRQKQIHRKSSLKGDAIRYTGGCREGLGSHHRGEWVFLFSFSVSQEFFIRISLRLEIEDLHFPLVRTPILKSYIFMLTGTKQGVLLTTSSQRQHARRIWLLLQKVWERGQRKRKEERAQQYQKEKTKKKTHKILFCTLWFVLVRKTAWLYPAARIHYRDLWLADAK